MSRLLRWWLMPRRPLRSRLSCRPRQAMDTPGWEVTGIRLALGGPGMPAIGLARHTRMPTGSVHITTGTGIIPDTGAGKCGSIDGGRSDSGPGRVLRPVYNDS